MRTYIIIFCIIATVFAIATLCYVVGSLIAQRRSREREIAITKASYAGSGWLLLGSMLGTAGGILAAYVTARPREKRKQHPSGEKRNLKK